MPIYGRGPIDEVTSPHPTDLMSTNEDSNRNSPYDFLQCCHPNATFKLVRAEELYRGISINTDMSSIVIDSVDNDDETDLSHPSINSPREKGQLLSKRQRTANMSEMNSLKNGNMNNEVPVNSDDEDDFIAKRDPRKRERKNSISAYGQVRRSARLLNKNHKHDHAQCAMYSSTSGIDSQSANDSTSNLNEMDDSKTCDAKPFNINEILCAHCKICSPCRNATLSPGKYKLFKKIKLVTNEGCDCVEMAAPFITTTTTDTSDETTPKQSPIKMTGSSSTKTPSKNVTIYVNEHSDCPTLFHQGAKSDSMLTCLNTRRNRKRPAECIDQDFKSVPTSRFFQQV